MEWKPRLGQASHNFAQPHIESKTQSNAVTKGTRWVPDQTCECILELKFRFGFLDVGSLYAKPRCNDGNGRHLAT